MTLGVENGPAATDVHVVACCGGDVCVLGKAALVDTLGGLDDFIKPLRDLGRRYAAAQDVGRRHGRAIELAVRVLTLDEYGALQREAGEQACARHSA